MPCNKEVELLAKFNFLKGMNNFRANMKKNYGTT